MKEGKMSNEYALAQYELENDLHDIAINNASHMLKDILNELETQYEKYHIAELMEDNAEIDRMYSQIEDNITLIHAYDEFSQGTTTVDISDVLTEWIQEKTDENFS